MFKAARILYIAGKVLAIIGVVLSCIAFAVFTGLAAYAVSPAGREYVAENVPMTINGVYYSGAEAEAEIRAMIAVIFLFSFAAAFAVTAGLCIAGLVVAVKQKDCVVNGSDSIKPYVLLIVFGALTDNICFVLCGIFSLVARRQRQNAGQ